MNISDSTAQSMCLVALKHVFPEVPSMGARSGRRGSPSRTGASWRPNTPRPSAARRMCPAGRRRRVRGARPGDPGPGPGRPLRTTASRPCPAAVRTAGPISSPSIPIRAATVPARIRRSRERDAAWLHGEVHVGRDVRAPLPGAVRALRHPGELGRGRAAPGRLRHDVRDHGAGPLRGLSIIG
jgi:hypothetical protein